MRANRKDLNHSSITDIIKELRDKHGVNIDFTDTHMIKGFCDFVLTYGFGEKKNFKDTPNRSFGETIMVEVKSKGGKTTRAEEDFIKKTCGDYLVVYSFEDLLFGMKNAAVGFEYLDLVTQIEDTYYNKILKKESPNQKWLSEEKKKRLEIG